MLCQEAIPKEKYEKNNAKKEKVMVIPLPLLTVMVVAISMIIMTNTTLGACWWVQRLTMVIMTMTM